jgi:hypothetical protein
MFSVINAVCQDTASTIDMAQPVQDSNEKGKSTSNPIKNMI